MIYKQRSGSVNIWSVKNELALLFTGKGVGGGGGEGGHQVMETMMIVSSPGHLRMCGR